MGTERISDDLKGRVALVTGASRGIGAATAALLASHGSDLIILGKSPSEDLSRVSNELSSLVEVRAMVCDSDDPDAIRDTYRQVKSEFGKLDFLVNNAGILEDALLGMISDENLRRVIGVNTVGPILHLQSAARLMSKAGGAIVNVSSIIGRVGNKGQTVYGASKAAIIGLTLSASKELAARNIRVNAVAPGFIGTDMTASLPRDKYNERIAAIALGRIGQPNDVAKAILFLLSDQSSYITGQILGVDGGMLI